MPERPTMPERAVHPDAATAVRIAPSVLSADFAQLGAEVDRVKQQADMLHVDVMDGHFVPNLTIGPPVVKWVRRHTDLYLDCHLMMDNPGQFLAAFKEAGADSCSVHIEIGGTGELVAQMRDVGLHVGLAFNPETPFAAVEPWLGDIDLLLVMTVHPGFGGQSFMSEVVPKIAQARHAIDDQGLGVALEVDGGVDVATAGTVVRAGARLLVAGSAIFSRPDPAAAALALRQAAEAAL